MRVCAFVCVYQVTLDLHSSQEKFGSFLRATLDVLSQLLELATLNDINKVNIKFLQSTSLDDFLLIIWTYLFAVWSSTNGVLFQCVEEILGYLKSCFSREPTMATVCVQQVGILVNWCVLSPGRIACVAVVFGFSTEQCAATSVTPRKVRLVPADRACIVIGFPVRWLHTCFMQAVQLCCHFWKIAVREEKLFCSCWRPCLAPTWPPSTRVCWVGRVVPRARPSAWAHPACVQAFTTTASWRRTPTSRRHWPTPASATWCRLTRSTTRLGEFWHNATLYTIHPAVLWLYWLLTWPTVIVCSKMVWCDAEGFLPAEVQHSQCNTPPRWQSKF